MIILTSKGNEGIAVQAMKLGAIDYVIKSQSNTTSKMSGLMAALKGVRLNTHTHRRDAKHAEDLFYFLCDLCALSEAGGEFSRT